MAGQAEEGEAMKRHEGTWKRRSEEAKVNEGKQKLRWNQRKWKCKCRKIEEGHLEITLSSPHPVFK